MHIGPHVSQLPPNGVFPVVQANGGNIRSMTVARSLFQQPTGARSYELIWHAAYMAAAAPSVAKMELHAGYIRTLISAARINGVSKIVMHTGATVDRDVDEIKLNLITMLNTCEVVEQLNACKIKLCIELAASISKFNCNPQFLGQVTSRYDNVGWCLDLAHVYGTGVSWERLLQIIDLYPPSVAHVNFPGTYYASSCDVHGWRHQPEVFKIGKTFHKRSPDDVKALTEQWDKVVRRLHQLKIPMIVEGSGFPGSGTDELALIRGLV